jgi:deazaflavin-dependent oxidoreductase (nitroreductase family)
MAARDRDRRSRRVTPPELARFAAIECCDLVTTGRRSGRPHPIEIWFGVVDDGICLISGNGPTADWYRNLLTDPSVEVHLAGQVWRGRARQVTDVGERRRVGELMGAKYVWGGDPSIALTYDAWCFDVPAVVVAPE